MPQSYGERPEFSDKLLNLPDFSEPTWIFAGALVFFWKNGKETDQYLEDPDWKKRTNFENFKQTAEQNSEDLKKILKKEKGKEENRIKNLLANQEGRPECWKVQLFYDDIDRLGTGWEIRVFGQVVLRSLGSALKDEHDPLEIFSVFYHRGDDYWRELKEFCGEEEKYSFEFEERQDYLGAVRVSVGPDPEDSRRFINSRLDLDLKDIPDLSKWEVKKRVMVHLDYKKKKLYETVADGHVLEEVFGVKTYLFSRLNGEYGYNIDILTEKVCILSWDNFRQTAVLGPGDKWHLLRDDENFYISTNQPEKGKPIQWVEIAVKNEVGGVIFKYKIEAKNQNRAKD